MTESRKELDLSLTTTDETTTNIPPEIAVFLDCDGTLTGRPGRETVKSDFYKSLLIGQKGERVLKSREEIVAALVDKFGEYTNEFNYKKTKDSNFLMRREALAFLKEILKDEKIATHIITRNRKEYVMALLTYHGLSNEELASITIKDSGKKKNDVRECKKAMKKPVGKKINAYVYDDDKKERVKMENAIYGTTGKYFKVVGDSRTPGNFRWPQYLREIKEQLAINANERKVRVSSPATTPSCLFVKQDIPQVIAPVVEEKKGLRPGEN